MIQRATGWRKIASGRFWGIPAAAEIWFLRVMKILDRLIASLRGCCQSLPDLRQGGDVRYTMADMSAFSLFFLQSPSFLAHQRRLEEGQGRSNCQTLFGLTATFARKSRSDFGLRRASRPDAPLAHRPPSPATTMSGRCWTRSVPTTSTQSSPRW